MYMLKLCACCSRNSIASMQAGAGASNRLGFDTAEPPAMVFQPLPPPVISKISPEINRQPPPDIKKEPPVDFGTAKPVDLGSGPPVDFGYRKARPLPEAESRYPPAF